ncbi:Uncharacterised protein r2_g3285 [Pycnogonum litorale]
MKKILWTQLFLSFEILFAMEYNWEFFSDRGTLCSDGQQALEGMCHGLSQTSSTGNDESADTCQSVDGTDFILDPKSVNRIANLDVEDDVWVKLSGEVERYPQLLGDMMSRPEYHQVPPESCASVQKVFGLSRWSSSDCDRNDVSFVCDVDETDLCLDGHIKNGYCFTYHNQTLDFDEASDVCSHGNGTLAVPTSDEENEYVSNLCLAAKGCTIGVKKIRESLNWKFTDGDTVLFFNWKNENRSNLGAEDNCVVINDTDGLWSRHPCHDDTIGSVCQTQNVSHSEKYVKVNRDMTETNIASACIGVGAFPAMPETQEDVQEISNVCGQVSNSISH